MARIAWLKSTLNNMALNKPLRFYHITLLAGLVIVLLNPIGLFNQNWLDSMSAAFLMCFHFDQTCNIDTYAELLGSSIPFALVTFFILIIWSNKQEKFKGFLILVVAYSLAHALHA